MKYNQFKGFKYKIIKNKKTIRFIDEEKNINCFKIEIEYPKIKYNVLINHYNINVLIFGNFLKRNKIKEIVEKYINNFLKENKQYIEVQK